MSNKNAQRYYNYGPKIFNNSPQLRLLALNELSRELRADESVFADLEFFLIRFECLLLDPLSQVRAATLRACRAFFKNPSSVEPFLKKDLLILFVVRSLERAADEFEERMQALKLIRRFVELSPEQVPISFVRSLVAIANFADDRIAPLSLETICELAVTNPVLVAKCGGFGTIVESVLGCEDEATIHALVYTMLFVMNYPESRKYVRFEEFEFLLSPFTDQYFMSSSNVSRLKSRDRHRMTRIVGRKQQLQACRIAVLAILRSWTGVSLLCSSNGLSCLIDILYLPDGDTKIEVLTLLYEVLFIDEPSSIESYLSNLEDQEREDFSGVIWESIAVRKQKSRSLCGNYLAVLLSSLVNVNILEALVHLINGQNRELSQRATFLAGEFLHLVTIYLPYCESVKLQSFAPLVSRATALDSEIRVRASTALNQVDQVFRAKLSKKVPYSLEFEIVARRTRAAGFAPSRLDRIENLTRSLLSSDDAFQQLLNNTNVVSSRQYTNWNWATLSDLFKGGLWFGRRIESHDSQRVIRRLIAFFLPSADFFPRMPNTHNNEIYTIVGCEMLDLLIQFDDRSLEKLFMEISESLIDLKDGIFSERNVQESLVSDYLLFIGNLTSSPRGCEILESCKIFTRLRSIIEEDRPDLHALILKRLDYSCNAQCRLLLHKMLIHEEKRLRILSVKHFRMLYRLDNANFDDWQIALLVMQLYDVDPDVSACALSVLNEVCESDACLEVVVRQRPAVLHLGEGGQYILLRMLETEEGLHYLHKTGFLVKQMIEWEEKFGKEYVKQVERSLAQLIQSSKPRYGDRSERLNINIPPHLYGSLSKTTMGCEAFAETYMVSNVETIQSIRDCETSPSMVDLIEIKASLWAIGHFASGAPGLNCLMNHEVSSTIISDIVNIAENCKILSLRGTSLYALGLIASTTEGSNVLKSLQWTSVERKGDQKEYISIALPTNILSFFEYPG